MQTTSVVHWKPKDLAFPLAEARRNRDRSLIEPAGTNVSAGQPDDGQISPPGPPGPDFSGPTGSGGAGPHGSEPSDTTPGPGPTKAPRKSRAKREVPERDPKDMRGRPEWFGDKWIMSPPWGNRVPGIHPKHWENLGHYGRTKEGDKYEKELGIGKYAPAPTVPGSSSGGFDTVTPAAAAPKGAVAAKEPHRHIVVRGSGADALADQSVMQNASVHLENTQLLDQLGSGP